MVIPPANQFETRVGDKLYIPVLRHRGFYLSRPQYPTKQYVHTSVAALTVEPYPNEPVSITTEMVFKACMLEFEEDYASQILDFFHMTNLPYGVVHNQSHMDPRTRTSRYALSTTFDIEVERMDELTAWFKLLART